MIDFYLPGIMKFFKLNSSLIELVKAKSSLIRADINIKAVYGVFPTSIFNGGRMDYGFVDVDTIQAILNYYENEDISLHYTFTNSLISEDHLQDHFCNLCLRLAHSPKNGVIVSHPLLYQYIKEKYPLYQLILSTTADIIDISEINRATTMYDLVVPSFQVRDLSILEQVHHKEKIELLAFDFCNPYCKNRLKHYQTICEYSLQYKLPKNLLELMECPRLFHINNYMENPHCIKPVDLSKYESAGFNKIKLPGRNLSALQLASIYADYFSLRGERDLLFEYLKSMI